MQHAKETLQAITLYVRKVIDDHISSQGHMIALDTNLQTKSRGIISFYSLQYATRKRDTLGDNALFCAKWSMTEFQVYSKSRSYNNFDMAVSMIARYLFDEFNNTCFFGLIILITWHRKYIDDACQASGWHLDHALIKLYWGPSVRSARRIYMRSGSLQNLRRPNSRAWGSSSKPS